jgi:hypothetical protein
MKTLILTIGIIIGFALSLAFNTYGSYINLIQVPEYINGYKTLDLLNYLSELKAQKDANELKPIPTSTKIKKDRKD